METLRNKSSISRDNKNQDPYWMNIIEEDPIQEGLGTDFKKQKGSGFRSSGEPLVCEFRETIASQDLRYRPVKYYDPVTNGDPPSMSEQASELGDQRLRVS